MIHSNSYCSGPAPARAVRASLSRLPPGRQSFPLALCRWLVLGAVALGSSGCLFGGSNLKPGEVEATEIAVLEAEQLGAERHASRALRQAEERLLQARTWLSAGREEEARRMLLEAQVLAELAQAESLASSTQEAAEIVRQSLDTLEKRIQSNAQESR